MNRIVALGLIAGVLVGCGGQSSKETKGPFATAATTAGATSGTSANSAATPTPPATAPATSFYRVSGWLPYWTYTNGQQIIDANAGNGLDEVNLFGIGIQPDGTLVKRNGIEDAARIAAIRNRGGEVIPTIYDVHDGSALASVLGSPTARARALQSMVDLLDQGGYDGIDVDFEHSKTATRDAFTQFIADLSALVRARGKVFSLTIPGKRRDLPSWGGYDYVGLAPHADRVKLMCYGFSGGWGGAGPLAPTDWIVKVLDYATSTLPADKIQVGIPFYGTDWPDNADPVKSRSFRSCRDLIAQHNATVVYEPTRGEAHFTYTDANGVGHTVWYSDGRSVAAKAALVKQYGVHGLSIWALGYGDTELWDAVRAELKQ